MIYNVKSIEEDIDFGCEERNEEIMAVVTLQGNDGTIKVVKQEDAMLIEKDINPGDNVYFNTDGRLSKALDEDWTKKPYSKNINTKQFTETLMAVKSGKELDWRCPFCGGNVRLISQTDGVSIIGCGDCDMRITLQA